MNKTSVLTLVQQTIQCINVRTIKNNVKVYIVVLVTLITINLCKIMENMLLRLNNIQRCLKNEEERMCSNYWDNCDVNLG